MGLVACATVPDIGDTDLHPAGSPQITGANGPLSARQSKALLSRLAAEGKQADLLELHLLVEQSLADTPLMSGNDVRLLKDGEESFRAIFTVIREAKHHINLESYILEDVESDDEMLSDLLVQKRREGVQVNIIYDSYGSLATPSSFFDRLRAAGANTLGFNPVDPLEAKKAYAPNDRDHRKLIVVDGAVAILGGVNLSTDYQSHPFPSSDRADSEVVKHWRDTDVRISGPAVAGLQSIFLSHWSRQKGPTLPEAQYFPPLPPRGDELVRIIGSSPDDSTSRYYVSVLSAIRTAQKRIWLASAYFVPTHQEKEELLLAARRGVDVRLLLRGESDSRLALAVQHSHYSDLLESGVLIFESHDEILHSKTVTIDGVWSVVGSSNFDHRSVIYNDEDDAVLIGTDISRQLEAAFEDDMPGAEQITLKQWRERSMIQNITDHLARLWQSLL